MRSILEQAVIYHLNGDAEKAQELFHQFIVARARQIHESMRNGETVTEGFEDDDVVNEEFFSEDDLAKLEDGSIEDEGADEDEFGAEAADDAEDAGAEVGDAEDHLDDAMDDMTAVDDNGVDDAEEGDLETRIEDLEAELERLAAEFEHLQSDEGEGDEFADDLDDADGLEDDMANDDAAPEEHSDMDDDDGGFPVHESEDMDGEDDEFDDIAESVVSELEKINVSMADGKEVADGASITQNKKSPLPQKKVDQRIQGAKPTASKQSEHKGYARETPPAVTTLKKRRNNVDSSLGTLTPVAKADKSDKGVGTGKNSNVTHKSPKSPVVPVKGVTK